MTTSNLVPLPQVISAVVKQSGVEITYAQVYKAVLNGVLPAEQVRGRWYMAPSDVQMIPSRLGLAAPAKTKTRRTPKHPAPAAA